MNPLTPDQIITLFILAVAILFFVTEWLRVDMVALVVVLALILTNILPLEDALAGFSNPVVLTIAALFVVGGAVRETGLADQLGRRLLKIAGDNPVRLTFVLMAAAALFSSFLSDTGTVAVLLPTVIVLARHAKLSPSRLLIPLSFASLLGGATTLIGTPPNLIVSNLLQENGLSTFNFFSFTPLGILLVIGGIAYVLLFGRRLLPDREPSIPSQPVENPAELIDRYRLPGNLFHLRVRKGSGLIGRTLSGTGLRSELGVSVLEIHRAGGPRPFIGRAEIQTLTATPDLVIEANDILVAQGEPTSMTQAATRWTLGAQPVDTEESEELISQEAGIAEVLMRAQSSLLGKTVMALRFGTIYGLNVLGLLRPGVEEDLDPLRTPLRFGDILLVQGTWQNIQSLRARRRDFVVLGQPEALASTASWRGQALALFILLALLISLILDLLPLAALSLLAALLFVLTGCLSADGAYQAVDWKSIVLVASMLPMSTALESVGLVKIVSEGVTLWLGPYGPTAVLAALFAITSLFSQVLSNTATTVLIAPIALASAISLGVQPQAFLMAVATAASMAFASPVASPVNTLVMAAGDYRFSDYLQIGLPLIILTLLISILALPVIFPF
ncbi:MAG: SLC13 family permease [Chloroflexi bacterium]|nr:MAG: SLC13 family permease [Chloroflexota bacterium]MBL1197138.1 SLC13 family permease [Chloroflexota bacterium]NOH14433.1 SLC13 family permease [Chloroflexota bacterium]